MPLPEADIEYLANKNMDYELVPFNNNQLLIIHNYKMPPAYTPDVVDFLVVIPPGYPNDNPDMFFVKPNVKLSNGNAPLAAEGIVNYHTEGWQQFSRHFNSAKWRPGIDGLAQYLTVMHHELNKGI